MRSSRTTTRTPTNRPTPSAVQTTWCAAKLSGGADPRALAPLVRGDVESIDERQAEPVQRDGAGSRTWSEYGARNRTARCATRAAAAPTATHIQKPVRQLAGVREVDLRNGAGTDGQRGDEQQQLGEPPGATERYAGSGGLSRDRRGGDAHEGQPSVEGSVRHC